LSADRANLTSIELNKRRASRGIETRGARLNAHGTARHVRLK
jgi:hypothetical protein